MVVLLGIGYAYLQTTLNISGTTKVSKNTWSIYWNNTQVKTGSVTGDQVTTAPTLSENDTKVSFSVNLKKPGEYYEFTVDAVNNGTIDAMIEDIDLDVDNGGSLPAYLDFSVTYNDDVPLVKNQILKAKATNENVETYKVRVEFKTDITSSDLPDAEEGETVVCTLNVSYAQADNRAIPVREILYSVSGTPIELGQPIPNGVETFDDPEDIDDLIFLKHVLTDGKVVLSYIGAKFNGNVYYALVGRNAYVTNKTITNYLFESDQCDEGLTRVNPDLSFLGDDPNHLATYCYGPVTTWKTMFDNRGIFAFLGKDDNGCCVLNDRSICGSSDDLETFIRSNP